MSTMIGLPRGLAGLVLAGSAGQPRWVWESSRRQPATDPPSLVARTPDPVAALEVAYVRASHLVPGLGSMVVGILPGQVRPGTATGTETVVSPSLGYGQVTPYAALPPGTYTVTIRDPLRHGAGAPVLTGRLALRPGAAYTVTALGRPRPPGSARCRTTSRRRARAGPGSGSSAPRTSAPSRSRRTVDRFSSGTSASPGPPATGTCRRGAGGSA